MPDWNFDGSSTNQAPGVDSEVVLKPCKIYRDPFRASVTDRQVQQQLRRRQSQSLHASGSSTLAPWSKRASRGPAEAALAAAAAASTSAATFTSAEYKPLVPSDSQLLQRSEASDSFSAQRVTGLTTEGGDDLDDLVDDIGYGDPGYGDGVGAVLDGCRNLLVICDTYAPATMAPLPTNTRAAAARIFDHPDVAAEEPWFGIEQEYTLLDATTRWPIGWPPGGYPAPQGPYYCGVGADRMFGRSIAEAHYTACHFAGLDVSGLNAEVMPGQWEFQVGPCVGLDSGDQLWVARYILQRVCELTGAVVVSLDPKPVPGDWNGAGAHTNFSTRSMREVGLGGIKEIERAIELLKANHREHIERYGRGNDRRLTGKHETAAMTDFTWGVADRGASIRVGNETFSKGAGYMEDRRPAANMDPYVVTSMLAQTTLLSQSTLANGTGKEKEGCESSSRDTDIVGGLTGAMASASMNGIGGDPFADDADSSASSAAVRNGLPNSISGGV